MKIDFIVSNMGSGGGERVLSIIANALSQKGYEVSIISFDQNIKDAFEIKPEINRIRLNTSRYKKHTLNNLMNLHKYYKLKRNRPDVLLPFMVETNMITILISLFFRIPCIASEHTNHVLRTRNYQRLFTRKVLYRFIRHVLVLTRFDFDYYKKNGSNPIVVPNPCSFEVSENSDNKRKQRILAVGNLNKYHTKGFDNLIPLVKSVFEKFPDWDLEIIGEIDDKSLKFLSSIAKENDLANKIFFSGFCSDVGNKMSAAEIFVLTSRFEGLPMVLIEALSQGMACIAYDCITGPADIIQDGINGILIKDQNHQKMSDGLKELINNVDLRRKLQGNGPKSIDRFKLENVIIQWEEILSSI